ncbi:MAG: TlyA family RNA methyltransferase [Limisphaerales bacterium]
MSSAIPNCGLDRARYSKNLPMQRLDKELVKLGFFPSREKAKVAILAGYVRVSGRSNCKPGDIIKPTDVIEVLNQEKYVSRGGYKLERALDYYQIDVTGMTALDIGASTGGFTDCLLQRGAAKVYAIDVGKGQLAWKLRNDPRVIVMEGINARYLNRSHFPPTFKEANIAVIDCSFISLKLIIPTSIQLLGEKSKIVALIKPQFEAGKKEADIHKGVIKDPLIHQRVIADLENFVKSNSKLLWRGVIESPIKGQSGNKEFLVYLEKLT